MMFNGWLKQALEIALVPLIVTGFGSGFAQIIKDAQAAGQLGEAINSIGFPGLLVPFIIGAAMECAVGFPDDGRHDGGGPVPADAGFPGHQPSGVRGDDWRGHDDCVPRERLRLRCILSWGNVRDPRNTSRLRLICGG